MTRIEGLEQEVRGIEARIQAAALAEDAEAYLRLRMRKAALPALIREEQAKPLRAEIQRLEDELEGLDKEMQRARDEPLPQVPAGRVGYVTPAMIRNQRIAEISAMTTRVGRELDARCKELAQIEAERPTVVPS